MTRQILLIASISDGMMSNGYLHPFWIIFIILASAIPVMFLVFLIYCGLNEIPFYLPFRVKKEEYIGPPRCPQCGKDLRNRYSCKETE